MRGHGVASGSPRQPSNIVEVVEELAEGIANLVMKEGIFLKRCVMWTRKNNNRK